MCIYIYIYINTNNYMLVYMYNYTHTHTFAKTCRYVCVGLYACLFHCLLAFSSSLYASKPRPPPLSFPKKRAPRRRSWRVTRWPRSLGAESARHLPEAPLGHCSGLYSIICVYLNRYIYICICIFSGSDSSNGPFVNISVLGAVI